MTVDAIDSPTPKPAINTFDPVGIILFLRALLSAMGIVDETVLAYSCKSIKNRFSCMPILFLIEFII